VVRSVILLVIGLAIFAWALFFMYPR